MRRASLIALSAAAVLAAAPVSALAIAMHSDDTLARFELRNDLYAAGENVRIAEAIDGDLNAAGQNVTTLAAVGGTVQAAGRNVNLRGPVGGNVRAAGSSVVLEGTVNGSVLAFGETVIVASGAVIDGDAVLMGTTVTIAGTVRGDVKINGENVSVTGSVGGETDLEGENVTLAGAVGGNLRLKAHSVSLANGAAVAGDTRFWTTPGTEDQRRIQDVTTGTATYDAALERARHDEPTRKDLAAAIFGALSIFALLTGALMIGVLQLATRKMFHNAAVTLDASPWKAMFVGVLYFTLLPVAAVLLLITLIGWPLSVAAGFIWIISLLLAKPLSAIVLARLIEKRTHAKWSGAAAFFASLGIYVALRLLMLVPIVGWIAVDAAICAAFGAYLMQKGKIFGQVR